MYYMHRMTSLPTKVSHHNHNAQVELRAGKLMARIESGTIFPIKGTHLIPGDQISYPDETLLSRTEQPGLGIVRSCLDDTCILYIASLPPCDFSPIINGKYESGTRIIIWFHSDGTYSIHGVYSFLPNEDVPCLLQLYQLQLQKRPEILTETQTVPFYTLPFQDETELDTFTIDPELSVDFDDAISINVKQQLIYIHIVKLSDLSYEEHERMRNLCFSLYLSNEHTEHLLDTNTASNRLSLVCGEKRDVITIRVKLDDEGLVSSYDIYPSRIIVKQRFDYDQVQEMIVQPDCRKDLVWLNHINTMRSQHIQYQIQLPSIRFSCIRDGTINEDSIRTETMNSSHSMIATAMILANMVISQHLHLHGLTIPNRFHERLRGIKSTSPISSNIFVDSFISVKKMARASYDIDQRGHFGLGITDYVHFTSPMRRYPDSLVQRILGGELFSSQQLEEEVQWINTRSAFCKMIQQLYSNWKIGRYISTLNNTYRVWITSVSKSGVIWYMPSFSLNGFTHVTRIFPTQYWKWDESKETLQGKNKIIHVGMECNGIIQHIHPISFQIQMDIN